MSELLTPFPYQIEGAKWLAPRAQALLADDMGLGKSCQAIRGADIIGAQNILVICPAAVRINWTREFSRFSPLDRPCVVLFEAKEKLPAAGVVVVSFEWATTNAHLLKAKAWDLIVIDEAHYLKERSAKRTKAIYGHGAKRPGVAASAKVVWRLTGTPAPNDASELYTHLKSMGAAKDEQYWDFTFRYCSGFDASFGYKITGHKNVEELKARLAPYMLRRKKEDVLKELPPIRYQEVTVDRSRVELDPEFYEQIQGQKITVEQFYDKLKVNDQTLRQALEATSGSGNPLDDRLRIIEGLAQNMVTLRRYIGMAKLPQCLDIIEEDLASGAVQKIVLFGVHQCVIEGARKRLAKYGAVTLYGLTPLEKRQQNIDKFQTNPKCRVFIGNVQAAGVGITLTAAHEVGFLEQDWVPANNSQATMRCHRIGQTNPVRVRIFSLHQSIDELVQQTLMRKARELAKIY